MGKVKVQIGDLFESNAQTLVNTVNCVGVMGKGVALGFKQRFPDMYEDYVARCKAGQVRLGRPYLYRRLITPWILNFPTKDHWRSVARLDDIVNGLKYLQEHYKEWGITSLAVPPLGCGEGQLEWRVVGPTLYRYLDNLDIPVELYAPFSTPSAELEEEFLSQPPDRKITPESRIRPGMIAIVEIIARIENEPYHWPIGRTMLQKIAYFATEEGLPTGLEYTRGSFGPFAKSLKASITQLANNGLIREEKAGRMFAVKVGSTFENARHAYHADLEKAESTIERVTDLFLRIRTTDQAEVAATVHFAAESLAKESKEKPSENQVLSEVMKWKQRRKPPLNDVEVAKTIRNLAVLGWLEVEPSSDLPLPEEELVDV